MDSLYNFRHLQIASAVAKAGGIRRASEQVHLSQPAISQAIAKLEAALGEPLFMRGARGMFLTASGSIFVARIDRAIGYLQLGQRELQQRHRSFESCPSNSQRLATTTQLRALLEVVDQRGYTPAARALGVSQPNVHRAVRELEKLFQRKLVLSSSSGVEPTSEAREFARWASLAFREIEQGLEELRERRGQNDGSIVIGSLPLVRSRILPTAVIRLLACHPDVKVRIIDGAYSELLNKLRAGQIDLILGALRLPSSANDLAQEALFCEPLSVVVRVGHPILDGPSPQTSALTELEWIAPNEHTPARRRFIEFFREHGAALPQRIIECSSLAAIRSLLMQSDRAALLSASQIHYESAAGELAIAPITLHGTERPIGICARADWAPTNIQSKFLTLVREVAIEVSATTLGPTNTRVPK